MIEKIIEKIIEMFPVSMQEKVSAVFAISFFLILMFFIIMWQKTPTSIGGG